MIDRDSWGFGSSVRERERERERVLERHRREGKVRAHFV
jgi:hypothetical protein